MKPVKVERNSDGSPKCDDVEIRGQQRDYISDVTPQPPRGNPDKD